jgi:glycogen debranching enzyme
VSSALVSILDGNTFMVSDRNGDVDPVPFCPTGLFVFDTRFLSAWELTVDGKRLNSLSVDDVQHFESRFFLVPGAATHYVDAKISVIRHRWIGASFHEHLRFINHHDEPADLRIRVDMASDFADIADVKEAQQTRTGELTATVESGGVRLAYQRDAFRRETAIRSSAPGEVDQRGMTFRVHLEPQAQWETEFEVQTILRGSRGHDLREKVVSHKGRDKGTLRKELDVLRARAPRLTDEGGMVRRSYERSLTDLTALRYIPLTVSEPIPAAGLPWYMTIFGRNSLLTCFQAMPFLPDLAVPTLHFLALNQGAVLDDVAETEPGKILHEVRYGERSAFEELPRAPYYGSADSTPLFVILLDEYERWSGDTDLARNLEPEARLALAWINEYADSMGDGYIWYQRRNLEHGLENQGWKDSPGAICYHDGRMPSEPRATCELQGYAYDAKLRGARLAREVWNDPGYAADLEKEAAGLRERFNRDFWVADGEYYALALDGDGGQVDALASNMGHLLWSGIVDRERAATLAEHLVGPRLFNGWGVRTLAEGEAAFNPVSHHLGAVWPWDNSFIAWGLRRYGFGEEAGFIARSILDAAQYFQGRLPDAFGGYPRELTKYPVGFPASDGPQSWSAGAPMLLIRTLLGLEPMAGHLLVDPALPKGMGGMELLDIPGRWGRLDAFARGRVEAPSGV